MQHTITSNLLDMLKQDPGQIVLFVGAGFSQNANLKGWLDLISPLANQVGYEIPNDPKLQAAEHFLTAAQYFENEFSRNALVSYLKRELRSQSGPSVHHRLLTLLPVKYIITTNYDSLLEEAYREAGIEVARIVQKSDIPYVRENQVQIIKLCGDLGYPESLTITKRDFNLYEDDKKEILLHLYSKLETKTAIFLGYSMRDPFLNQVWDRIDFSLGRHHRLGFAVMFEVTDQEKLDLKKRNIQVIELDPRTDKKNAMREWLEDLVKSAMNHVNFESIQKYRLADGEIRDALLRIEEKLDRGTVENQIFYNLLLDAVQKNQLSQADNYQLIAEIRSWIDELKNKGYVEGDDDLKKNVSALTEHSGTAAQYLQLAIPIIPGLLNYNIELGSQHIANIKNIFNRKKNKK